MRLHIGDPLCNRFVDRFGRVFPRQGANIHEPSPWCGKRATSTLWLTDPGRKPLLLERRLSQR